MRLWVNDLLPSGRLPPSTPSLALLPACSNRNENREKEFIVFHHVTMLLQSNTWARRSARPPTTANCMATSLAAPLLARRPGGVGVEQAGGEVALGWVE